MAKLPNFLSTVHSDIGMEPMNSKYLSPISKSVFAKFWSKGKQSLPGKDCLSVVETPIYFFKYLLLSTKSLDFGYQISFKNPVNI